MALPRPSSPRAAWSDLKAFFSGEHRHRLLFGVLAILMPVIIVIGFITDAHTNILPGRSIMYIQSWPADRSDAEIIAQQKIDQKKREAAALERQRSYQRLEKQLGM
jgi:hypothetical protein